MPKNNSDFEKLVKDITDVVRLRDQQVTEIRPIVKKIIQNQIENETIKNKNFILKR